MRKIRREGKKIPHTFRYVEFDNQWPQGLLLTKWRRRRRRRRRSLLQKRRGEVGCDTPLLCSRERLDPSAPKGQSFTKSWDVCQCGRVSPSLPIRLEKNIYSLFLHSSCVCVLHFSSDTTHSHSLFLFIIKCSKKKKKTLGLLDYRRLFAKSYHLLF